MQRKRVKEISIKNKNEIVEELERSGEVCINGVVTIRKIKKKPRRMWDGINKRYIEKPEYETLQAKPSLGLRKLILTK